MVQESRAQGIDSQQERGADQHEGDWVVNILKILLGISLSQNLCSVCDVTMQTLIKINISFFLKCFTVFMPFTPTWVDGRNRMKLMEQRQ